ncbi:carboxylating nicotinate-nucleotide diphosphorylase [Auritidibacter sp. NML100628]|uniref:carboxylating nicotinate-nucleotide diphosphorylase n=1 Tax=Auritidibacter sp. NML100628 TaxID=2170742 RepID=UPI000D72C553|nr:carboxylating nicotinate-nucleotide diphosphorylase [Auritidibacter sp. NML100628]PXA76970.1 carboxylating nicotinate-nucleotide diphosphorylase [Auritidibacter sp. NML100628]
MKPSQIDRVIHIALEEDVPFGDLTTQAFVPATAQITAELVAREPGVFSGGEVFVRALTALNPEVAVDLTIDEGAEFDRGQVLAGISGPARPILTCERIGLNLVQRMCGIATTTAAYVAAVAGTRARIVDTRKTTPGLRALERHAVRCGGGHNHRFSLSDAVLAKDNHLAVVATGGRDLTSAIRDAKAQVPHTVHLEVEVDRLDQIPSALHGGADTIMLDNFSLQDLHRGVELIAGQALVEASGGVRLETVGDIAATGVDLISVGALTHHIRALDLGLDFS